MLEIFYFLKKKCFCLHYNKLNAIYIKETNFDLQLKSHESF